jgi:hypothetical protein
MATTINADTSDGLKLTADTSGTLELQSAGSTKVTMDTNGNVGIGTTTPSFETGTGLEIRYAGGLGGHLKLTDSASGAGGSNGFDLYAYNTAGYIENYESGSTVFRNNGGESMRIDSGGRVGIGNSSPASYGMMIIDNAGQTTQTLLALKDSGGSGTHSQIQFYNTNGVVGSITTASSSTSYNTSSDYRLKENVAPMSDSIDRLKQLKPSTWAWIQDGSHGEGFLAHEAQSIVPEAITGTKDAMKTEEYEVTPAVEATYDEEDNELTPAVEAVMGTREVPDHQGIDQSKLVPLLTSALQEAVTKIEDLETRIEALENA